MKSFKEIVTESLRSTSRYARRDHYHQIHGDKAKPASSEKKEHHVYSHMDHAQLSRHIRQHMSDHVEYHEGKAKSSVDKSGHHTIHHAGGDEHLGASVKHMHDDAPASKPGHRVHIHSKDGHVHTLDHIKGTLQHYSKKK